MSTDKVIVAASASHPKRQRRQNPATYPGTIVRSTARVNAQIPTGRIGTWDNFVFPVAAIPAHLVMLVHHVVLRIIHAILLGVHVFHISRLLMRNMHVLHFQR